MTISFPSSPVDQQVYAPGGSAPNYIYSTALGVWQVSGPYGSAFAPINTPTFVAPVGIGTGGTALTGAVLQATGTSTTTQQLEVQNLSSGTTASTDVVATANDGTDSTNYIDLGINSSGNADPAFTVAAAHDGYLYTSSGNLAIGTATSGTAINLFAGGTLSANLVASVSASGITVGSPTGGAMGAGSINVTALYVNGVPGGTTMPLMYYLGQL